MIELRDKQILIDGRPRMIMAGEIQYFRLSRDEWADRLDKLAATGANAVASYIPWLWHELPDGRIDVTGETRPERDLGAFIDLCAERGMWFFARPGPFVMSELKNEGLPFRLYDEHPEIVPITWDGAPVPTRTVDYLAPDYLQEVRRWYDAVLPVLRPRLLPVGGNVIGVQLDNEVGMLSWISNSPDLTDEWTRMGHSRSPDESIALPYLCDLGYYMRRRFARYVEALRGFAEDNGIRGVPFVINIHGTSNGSAATFPIGISQLVETYRGVPQTISGSDIYLGDLTSATVHDLYLVNAFMDAVHDADQPLTSVEFQAGCGNYSGDFEPRLDAASVDLKTRMCVAQGVRLFNYYLFAGGINPRLDTPVGDGNDRIGFVGERHGFSAPIDPEGETGATYDDAAQAIAPVMALADQLAVGREEHDDVTLGFLPDYFMTESRYPSSASMAALVADLERYRGGGTHDGALVRAMLRAGYRFGATDLQSAMPDRTQVLALACAHHLDSAVQQRLSDFVRTGGRLLLYGALPTHDMVGEPCTVLADALGIGVVDEVWESREYYPSVCAVGWAAPRPEVRVRAIQLCTTDTAEVVLQDYATGQGCGFEVALGEGRALVITTDYPCDVDFFGMGLRRLGVEPRLQIDRAGPFVTSTVDDSGERMVHALNPTAYQQDFRVRRDGVAIFGDAMVTLPPRGSAMLPVNMQLGPLRLAWSTCEPVAVSADEVVFRNGSQIALDTTDPVDVSPSCEVAIVGGRTVIRPARDQHHITVRLTGKAT